jgi:hypothetical protein
MKKWMPLQPAYAPRYSDTERVLAMQMERDKCTREQAIETLQRYEDNSTYWKNDLYQVQKRIFFNDAFQQDMVHLNIRRVDGAAIFDWRHRQLIKNELVGEECEAFEIYPAESRLVDTSNKYHLWCFVHPNVRIPVQIDGGRGRDVEENEIRSPAGERQRRIMK